MDRRLLIGLLVVTAVASAAGAASPQPTPVCPVCGTTFHENVTGSTATLGVQVDGDVRWRVETQVANPTASEWRRHPEEAHRVVADAVEWRAQPPYRPTIRAVRMEGDTLVVELVDENAARWRFGVLVLPYLHGEGVEARWVINADRLEVVPPDGYRVINDPRSARMGDRGVVWEGSTGEPWDAPEPGDTYVVMGRGPIAGIGTSVALTTMPLDPVRYGLYIGGLLIIVFLVATVALACDLSLSSRVVVGGVGGAAGVYTVSVASVHPIAALGTLPGLADQLFLAFISILSGLVAGLGLFVWTRV